MTHCILPGSDIASYGRTRRGRWRDDVLMCSILMAVEMAGEGGLFYDNLLILRYLYSEDGGMALMS
jgi:hypothetical protein